MATTEQAARNAEAAREKMQGRRQEMEGAAGWVAERAGKWSLDGVDDRFVSKQKYLWNPLMDYYEEVRQSIQGGMDALARRRTFPVFG
jgi:hypothetical protein